MPKKSLEEMLSENTGRTDALEAARRQAVFLALWDEIQECYMKGWSYSEIWRTLHREGAVDFAYSTFMHFIQKMRRRQLEAEQRKGPVSDKPAVKPSPPAAPPAVPGSTRVEMPRFGDGLPPRDPKKF